MAKLTVSVLCHFHVNIITSAKKQTNNKNNETPKDCQILNMRKSVSKLKKKENKYKQEVTRTITISSRLPLL